jgi:hypothetical protein
MMKPDDVMFPEEELPVLGKGVTADLTVQLEASARDMAKWALAALAALNSEGVFDTVKAAEAKTALTKAFHDCGASAGMTSYTQPDPDRGGLDLLLHLGERMVEVGDSPYIQAAAANDPDLDHTLFYAMRQARWTMTTAVFHTLCMIESAASAFQLSSDDKIELIQLRTHLQRRFPPYENGPAPPLTWSNMNA